MRAIGLARTKPASMSAGEHSIFSSRSSIPSSLAATTTLRPTGERGEWKSSMHFPPGSETVFAAPQLAEHGCRRLPRHADSGLQARIIRAQERVGALLVAEPARDRHPPRLAQLVDLAGAPLQVSVGGVDGERKTG